MPPARPTTERLDSRRHVMPKIDLRLLTLMIGAVVVATLIVGNLQPVPVDLLLVEFRVPLSVLVAVVAALAVAATTVRERVRRAQARSRGASRRETAALIERTRRHGWETAR